ncbi:MAG: lipopolysaccharide biosynthesis protein [Candidatus Omnitrophica bacterium]|nr:lipopolysaccharide biosynthesis protein [Candidatus Omnitrophota bacterium]
MCNTISTNESDSLKERSLRGAFFSISSTLFQQIISVVIVAFLARILQPADFGVTDMVVAFTLFAEPFVDMGLILFTVNRQNLTHSQWSNLFWINLILGLLLASLIINISPLIGLFYNYKDAGRIAVVFGLCFIPLGVSIQPSALLIRQLRFARIAFIEFVSLVIGGLVAIKMALAGFGPFAIAWRMLVYHSIRSVLLLFFVTWKPLLPTNILNFKEIFLFGSKITGYNLIKNIPQQFDKILLGRTNGRFTLGLYSRAFSLAYLPIIVSVQSLIPVFVSLLSKFQDRVEKFTKTSLQIFKMISFLIFPIFFLCFISAMDIIHLFYGLKWLEIVPIFRILSIGFLCQGIIWICECVFISIGKPGIVFRVSIIRTVVICLSFMIGLRWGMRGVAIAFSASTVLMLLPYLFLTASTLSLRVTLILKEMILPLIASIIMVIMVHVFRYVVNDMIFWGLRFIISVVLGLIVYIFIITLFQRKALGSIALLIKSAIFREKADL